MPFIKVMPVQGRVSFVNIAAIRSITEGGPEDADVGPAFVITFRNGHEVVCRGEAEEARRKIAAAEK